MVNHERFNISPQPSLDDHISIAKAGWRPLGEDTWSLKDGTQLLPRLPWALVCPLAPSPRVLVVPLGRRPGPLGFTVDADPALPYPHDTGSLAGHPKIALGVHDHPIQIASISKARPRMV